MGEEINNPNNQDPNNPNPDKGGSDPKPSENPQEVTQNEDGTITFGGKKFISHKSYEEVAERQRENSAKLKQFETEKSEAEKKRLEEEGKFKELAESETKKREELEQAMVRDKKVFALKLAATQAGAVDAEAVEKLANLDEIQVSEDGAVDSDSVKSVVDSLKKDKAYLFGTKKEGDDTPPIGNEDGGNPPGGGGEKKTFLRSQLSDAKFYQENRKEILEAAKDGRIVNDVTPK